MAANLELVFNDISSYKNLEEHITTLEKELRTAPNDPKLRQILAEAQENAAIKNEYEQWYGKMITQRTSRIKRTGAASIIGALGGKAIAVETIFLGALTPLFLPALPAAIAGAAALEFKRRRAISQALNELDRYKSRRQHNLQEFKIFTGRTDINLKLFVSMTPKERAAIPIRPELQQIAQQMNIQTLYEGELKRLSEISKHEGKTIQQIKLNLGNTIASKLEEAIQQLPPGERKHTLTSFVKPLTDREREATQISKTLNSLKTEEERVTFLEAYSGLETKEEQQQLRRGIVSQTKIGKTLDREVWEKTGKLIYKKAKIRTVLTDTLAARNQMKITNTELRKQAYDKLKELRKQSITQGETTTHLAKQELALAREFKKKQQTLYRELRAAGEQARKAAKKAQKPPTSTPKKTTPNPPQNTPTHPTTNINTKKADTTKPRTSCTRTRQTNHTRTTTSPHTTIKNARKRVTASTLTKDLPYTASNSTGTRATDRKNSTAATTSTLHRLRGARG